MNNTMKRFILILAVAAFGLTACDFLDREPLSEMTEDIYFKTAEDLQLFTNPLYNNMLDKSSFNHQSDHYIKLSLSNVLHGGTYRTVPESGGGWTWTDLRRMNTLLSRLDECEDAGARAQYEALTRFFRAFFYFEKVKRFGDVPWIDEELGSDSEKLYAPRDSRELIMQHMLEDIDFAIDNLPSAVSTFRVNKWAALALKAQFCLYEGTFRKYHGLEISAEEAGVEYVNSYEFYIREAAEAAEAVIDGGMYKLFTTGNPSEDYRTLFAQEDASKDEYILAIHFSYAAAIFNNSTAMALLPAQGRLSATRKFVNTYLMADGSRFTEVDGYDKMEFYDEFQNRDPRLAQTLRAPGYRRINGDRDLAPDLSCSATGYHIAKWTMAADANGGDSDRADRATNDVPVYRYAEVLLNYAEAKAELGEFGQAEADKSINLLRARVGMVPMNLNVSADPYLTDPKTGYQNPVLLSHPNLALVLEVRRERGVELAQEGNFRWDDLMRWKEGKMVEQDMFGLYFPGAGEYDLDKNGTIDLSLYTDTKPKYDSKDPKYADAVVLKIGSEILLSDGESGYVDPQQNSQHTFDENRDYYYPIPSDERSLNPNLSQNPGWDDGLDF